MVDHARALPTSREPPRTQPTRSRERCVPANAPEYLPSSENLCPATPFRASGSGLLLRPRLGHRSGGYRHLFTPHVSCETLGASSSSTRPVANGSRASLDLGVAH